MSYEYVFAGGSVRVRIAIPSAASYVTSASLIEGLRADPISLTETFERRAAAGADADRNALTETRGRCNALPRV